MGPFSGLEGKDKDVDESDVPAGLGEANRHSAVSPNLAHSLPAALNHRPADSAGMRDALFPSHPSGRRGEAPPQRSSKRRTAEGSAAPLRQDSLRPKMGRGLGFEAAEPEEVPARPSRGSNAWVKGGRAVLPPAFDAGGERFSLMVGNSGGWR